MRKAEKRGRLAKFDGLGYYERYKGSFLSRLRRKLIGIRYVFYIKKFCKNGKLLDVGCATGDFCEVAGKCGYETVGIDVSPYMIKEAVGKGVKAFLMSVEEMRFKKNCFDVVTMFSVLQYVKNPIDTLMVTREVLKPRGVLFVHVPSDYFNSDTLAAMLKKTGFEVVFWRNNILPLGKFVECISRNNKRKPKSEDEI